MSKIEAVLRKICAQAVDSGLTLQAALLLFRSVATLARALRTERVDQGLPRGFAPDLHALLATVLDHACERALDPDATPTMIASLARAIGSLQTAVRLARAAAPKKPPTPPADTTIAPEPVATKQNPKRLVWKPVPMPNFGKAPTLEQAKDWADALAANLTLDSLPYYPQAA